MIENCIRHLDLVLQMYLCIDILNIEQFLSFVQHYRSLETMFIKITSPERFASLILLTLLHPTYSALVKNTEFSSLFHILIDSDIKRKRVYMFPFTSFEQVKHILLNVPVRVQSEIIGTFFSAFASTRTVKE